MCSVADHINDWLQVNAQLPSTSSLSLSSVSSVSVSLSFRDIVATIGVTNQRETTIAWHRQTGVPYYNAIVWDDTRTTVIASKLATDHDGGNNIDPNRFRSQTGLPLASYFAGTKVKWLLDHVESIRQDLNDPIQREYVCFGTVDTWLIYQLTGFVSSTTSSSPSCANVGGRIVTDVTNASRWLFMNIQSCQWDAQLVQAICDPHEINIETALPKICPSCDVNAYGTITGCAQDDHDVPISSKNEKMTLPARNFYGISITAVMGDQQAALFGQTAFDAGQAKNTYGTGMFLMMNTGTDVIHSQHGLLTTVAYQIGTRTNNTIATKQIEPVYYALEGSVSHSGSTIQWLRDQVGIIQNAAESETIAKTTSHNDGMYMVPAFAGLFAPHWRSDARACMVGLTSSHHKGHICRAALEAAAYQAREVFDAIVQDSGVTLSTLNVDGGGTNNELLMQFQADIIPVPVVKPMVMETTAMGAAFAAGLAVGIWNDLHEIKQLWAVDKTFEPQMTIDHREKLWMGWQKAVRRSYGWVTVEGYEEEDDYDPDEDYHIVSDATVKENIPGNPAEKLIFDDSWKSITIVIAALACGYWLGTISSRRN
jgi:glycerol kinase